MATKIQMGNDEFILYIRKTSKCKSKNDDLGRKVWKWLEKKGGKKLFNGKKQPCLWGESAANIDPFILPKKATQFEFDRDLLPKLYEHLDVLKNSLSHAKSPLSQQQVVN